MRLVSTKERIRVASVGYVNARPLIAGLDADAGVTLSMHVPSKLLGTLQSDATDVALLPVIDYPAVPGLRVIPAGGIGCDGPTLTVRLFSQVPPGEVRVVACDPDSHTSVALAKILFARQFNASPTFIDLRHAAGTPGEARLLIGDKVVCEEPIGFEHEVDLGHAWKQLTGLPFVFAIWCAKADVALGDLPQRLVRAKERGLKDVQKIIDKYAVPRGWPAGVALQYLTYYLKYDIHDRQIKAIELFHRYAADLGLIPPAKPLDLIEIAPAKSNLWGDD
jgi:chorismate dehydratase